MINLRSIASAVANCKQPSPHNSVTCLFYTLVQYTHLFAVLQFSSHCFTLSANVMAFNVSVCHLLYFQYPSPSPREDGWGFTALFDPKGEPKPQKQLPDKISYYSSHVPMATSQVYGSRLNSPSGHSMRQLERMMASSSRSKTDITKLPCD